MPNLEPELSKCCYRTGDHENNRNICIRKLVKPMLQQLKHSLNAPIIITSGYRSDAHNAKIMPDELAHDGLKTGPLTIKDTKKGVIYD